MTKTKADCLSSSSSFTKVLVESLKEESSCKKWCDEFAKLAKEFKGVLNSPTRDDKQLENQRGGQIGYPADQNMNCGMWM